MAVAVRFLNLTRRDIGPVAPRPRSCQKFPRAAFVSSGANEKPQRDAPPEMARGSYCSVLECATLQIYVQSFTSCNMSEALARPTARLGLCARRLRRWWRRRGGSYSGNDSDQGGGGAADDECSAELLQAAEAGMTTQALQTRADAASDGGCRLTAAIVNNVQAWRQFCQAQRQVQLRANVC